MSRPLSPPNFIIDTLQMVRGVGYDNTYAADDVFSRISGTTAISGAVDSSFTLAEEQRGSGRARLSCVGRDIEYRELELRRSNGKRLIELHRIESTVSDAPPKTNPCGTEALR